MASKPHKIDESPHSSTGASGMYRWEHCAGSVNLIKKIGKRALGSGRDAALGTTAHVVLSDCLTKDMEPWEFMGSQYIVSNFDFTVDKDMADAVLVALDHIQKIIKNNSNAKVIKLVEKSLQHSENKKLYGTTDFALVVITDVVRIIIVDYKHGIHVNVEPTGPQMKYYAALIVDYLLTNDLIGSWREIAEVELWIVQPRQPHPEGVIRDHLMTGQELKDWYTSSLLPAVKRTEDPHALLTVGDWCGFCPARMECEALKSATMNLSTAVEPEKLTTLEIVKIKLQGAAIQKYLEQIDRVAFVRAQNGESLVDPETGLGFKIVNKQANRVWKTGAKKTLLRNYGMEVMTEPELKSPAQIELTIDDPKIKKVVAGLAFTPTTGLTLAKLTDKRRSIRSMAESLLDVLDQEEMNVE